MGTKDGKRNQRNPASTKGKINLVHTTVLDRKYNVHLAKQLNSGFREYI